MQGYRNKSDFENLLLSLVQLFKEKKNKNTEQVKRANVMNMYTHTLANMKLKEP